MKTFLRLAIVALFSTVTLVAQNPAPPSPTTTPTRQEPCWRQAGISQSAMQQRHEIERDTHSQVAAVCENSSLTPQQKQQQVKEIHNQAQGKMNALITPEQQSTLHACQQQRSGNRTPNEGHRPGVVGPCGNLPASQGRQGAENGSSGGSPQPPEN
jgi:Spy/CpxP family protein refolding chaperone